LFNKINHKKNTTRLIILHTVYIGTYSVTEPQCLHFRKINFLKGLLTAV